MDAKWMFRALSLYVIPILLDVNETNTTADETGIFSAFSIGLGFLIVGIIFVIIEATTPGFFIGIPGTILVILGLLLVYFPELISSIWGPIILLVLVLMVTAGVFWIYRRMSKPEEQSDATTTIVSLVGKTGKVTRKVVPDSLSGKVEINSQTWSATSEDGEIPEGAMVEVVGAEGVHVVVRAKVEMAGTRKKR